jgi:hypothetical protein
LSPKNIFSKNFLGIVSPEPSALLGIIDYIERYLIPVEESLEVLGNAFEGILSLVSGGKLVLPNAKRAFGAAVEVAMSLLSQTTKIQMKPLFSRILSFLSGAPNYGPGAIPDVGDTQTIEYHRAKAVNFFKKISVKAQEIDAGIDVFCIGLKQFFSPVLQNLVLSNGGLVIMQKEILPEFSQNILMSLSKSKIKNVVDTNFPAKSVWKTGMV